MAGLYQLYQRLHARATHVQLENSGRTRTVCTEVTVEQEERLWLLRDLANRRDDVCPACGHLLPGQREPTECLHGQEALRLKD